MKIIVVLCSFTCVLSSMNLKHIKNFNHHFAVGDYLMWTSGVDWLVEEVLGLDRRNMQTFIHFTSGAHKVHAHNETFWYSLKEIGDGAMTGNIRIIKGVELLVWAM